MEEASHSTADAVKDLHKRVRRLSIDTKERPRRKSLDDASPTTHDVVLRDEVVEMLSKREANSKPYDTMSVREARAAHIAGLRRAPEDEDFDVRVTDRTIRCGKKEDQVELTIRVYSPHHMHEAGEELLPGIVWAHGGGFVLGNLDSCDASLRLLCNSARCVVVSVDYRLAPEHAFPVPAMDVYYATKWVATNASALGIDASRLAIGGDSAGGNLATIAAILAKKSRSVRLAFQVLVYPVTNFDLSTASYRRFAKGYGLTAAEMLWFWSKYLPTEADGSDWRASPLRAPLDALQQLPPTLVVTAEADVLRDEGAAYAARLAAAGVRVEFSEYAGLIHGFFRHSDCLASAREVVLEIAVELCAAFYRPDDPDPAR
eukprot:tig00001339_g8265.t1